MSYIQTHAGQHVNLAHPDPRTIRIIDIAHALGRINRFGGHTQETYSVAQHSVLVSRLVKPELALEALLHDATEAYLGDVSSPLKAMLPDYQRIEHKFDLVIRERFGLHLVQHPDVKMADLRMLATERRDILGHDGTEWPMLKGIEPADFIVTPWEAPMASRIFLSTFQQLAYKRLP